MAAIGRYQRHRIPSTSLRGCGLLAEEKPTIKPILSAMFAYGIIGCTALVVPFAANAALKAPTNLVATAVSTNQINLSWTDTENNEDGFNIERAPDSAGVAGTWAQIATVGANVTTYSDTSASADTKYWYRVRAYNNGGDSAYSNEASATTPPLPPSNLTATTVSSNQIDLAWTDNSNTEDGFKIERAPDSGGSPGMWTQIATIAMNITAYSDNGLTLDTKYWYRVRGYNAGGDSSYGNQASATTLPLPPAAPSGLTTTAVFASQVNLSWNDNSSDEDGFKIERSVDGTNFVQIAQVLPNAPSYRDTRAWPDTSYYYRVSAYNAGGDSGFSNNADAHTLARCPTSLVGWGLNDLGQATAPTGFFWVVDIAAGYLHSLAISADHAVIAWGDNTYGQASPPSNLTDVVAIAAGSYHSLALKGDGTILGWGDNTYWSSISTGRVDWGGSDRYEP